MIDYALVQKLISSLDAKTLRELAAILLTEADKREGKTPSTYFGTNLGDPREVEVQMRREIAEREAAREPIARCYETHKNLWKAAEREGWPEYPGSPNRYWSGNFKTAQAFTAGIVALMKTDEAKAWMAHPLNASLLPKVEPTV